MEHRRKPWIFPWSSNFVRVRISPFFVCRGAANSLLGWFAWHEAASLRTGLPSLLLRVVLPSFPVISFPWCHCLPQWALSQCSFRRHGDKYVQYCTPYSVLYFHPSDYSGLQCSPIALAGWIIWIISVRRIASQPMSLQELRWTDASCQNRGDCWRAHRGDWCRSDVRMVWPRQNLTRVEQRVLPACTVYPVQYRTYLIGVFYRTVRHKRRSSTEYCNRKRAGTEG
jgi:hypothetical protein